MDKLRDQVEAGARRQGTTSKADKLARSWRGARRSDQALKGPGRVRRLDRSLSHRPGRTRGARTRYGSPSRASPPRPPQAARRRHPVHVVDALHATAYGLQDVPEVPRVAHLEGEARGGLPGRGRSGRRPSRMLTGWSDRTRVTSDSSRDRSAPRPGWRPGRPRTGWRPLDFDDALGLRRRRLDVDAVAAVNGDAAAAGDEADDGSPGTGCSSGPA